MSLSSLFASVAAMGAPMCVSAGAFADTVRTVLSPSVKTGGTFIESITANGIGSNVVPSDLPRK